MKKIYILFFVCIVAFTSFFVFRNFRDRSEKITIGAILPLSDFGAFWGELTKIGMDMAVSDLQKEGINIEVVYEDSKGKGDIAVSAAQKLMAVNNVDILYTDFSGPSSAVSPIAKNNGKTFVYSSFDPGNLKTNPFALKTFFNAVGECKQFSDYLKTSKGITKVAYLGVNLSFTQACVDEMVGVFGQDNVIVEAAASPSVVDFRSSLLKIKNFGTEFIFGVGYEANYKAIFTQKSELGINIPVFCNLSDCYTNTVAKSVSPQGVEGSIFFDYFLEDAFKERLDRLIGPDKNYRGVAFAYDIIQYVGRAAQACKGSKDTACIVNHVSNNTKYTSVVPGKGFDGGRSFNVKSSYVLIKDGKQVVLK